MCPTQRLSDASETRFIRCVHGPPGGAAGPERCKVSGERRPCPGLGRREGAFPSQLELLRYGVGVAWGPCCFSPQLSLSPRGSPRHLLRNVPSSSLHKPPSPPLQVAPGCSEMLQFEKLQAQQACLGFSIPATCLPSVLCSPSCVPYTDPPQPPLACLPVPSAPCRPQPRLARPDSTSPPSPPASSQGSVNTTQFKCLISP